MFIYCDINTRDVARLERAVTKTDEPLSESFLAFRKSSNIPSAFISQYINMISNFIFLLQNNKLRRPKLQKSLRWLHTVS